MPLGTVATVAITFLSLPYFFSSYIYYYIDTTNFTIFSQLLRCQFLISQNKIGNYDQPQLKINVFQKYELTDINSKYLKSKNTNNQKILNKNSHS